MLDIVTLILLAASVALNLYTWRMNRQTRRLIAETLRNLQRAYNYRRKETP